MDLYSAGEAIPVSFEDLFFLECVVVFIMVIVSTSVVIFHYLLIVIRHHSRPPQPAIGVSIMAVMVVVIIVVIHRRCRRRCHPLSLSSWLSSSLSSPSISPVLCVFSGSHCAPFSPSCTHSPFFAEKRSGNLLKVDLHRWSTGAGPHQWYFHSSTSDFLWRRTAAHIAVWRRLFTLDCPYVYGFFFCFFLSFSIFPSVYYIFPFFHPSIPFSLLIDSLCLFVFFLVSLSLFFSFFLSFFFLFFSFLKEISWYFPKICLF